MSWATEQATRRPQQLADRAWDGAVCHGRSSSKGRPGSWRAGHGIARSVTGGQAVGRRAARQAGAEPATGRWQGREGDAPRNVRKGYRFFEHPLWLELESPIPIESLETQPILGFAKRNLCPIGHGALGSMGVSVYTISIVSLDAPKMPSRHR